MSDEEEVPFFSQFSVSPPPQPRLPEPPKITNKKKALVAIRKDVNEWFNLSDELQLDKELVLEVVSQEAEYIEYVPVHLQRDKDVVMAAILTGDGLPHVSDEFKMNKEIQMLSASRNGWGTLSDLLDSGIDPDMDVLMAALSQNGASIQLIPPELLTPELAIVSVSENGENIRFIPDHLLIPEVVMAAVSQDGLILRYLQDEIDPVSPTLVAALHNPEIAMAAVSENGLALEYVPDDLLTQELLFAAVGNTSDALKYLPESMQENNELLDFIISRGISIPNSKIDEKMEFSVLNDKLARLRQRVTDRKALRATAKTLKQRNTALNPDMRKEIESYLGGKKRRKSAKRIGKRRASTQKLK